MPLRTSAKKALTISVTLALGLPAAAQFTFPTVYTDGHIEVWWAEYTGGRLSLAFHDTDMGVTRDPSGVIVGAPKLARTTWPGGSQWSFLASPGQRVWVLPQVQNRALPFAGASSESMSGSTFDRYFNSDARVNRNGRWVGFEVRAVRGPGEFAMWQTGSFGTPTVWVTTKDGLGPDDVLWTLEGGHVHFNWGFTSHGRYEIDVVVSARLGGARIESPVRTYVFGVEWGFPVSIDDYPWAPLGGQPFVRP